MTAEQTIKETSVSHLNDIPHLAVDNTVFLVYHATLKQVICSRVIRRIYRDCFILESGKKVSIHHFPTYERAAKKRDRMLELRRQNPRPPVTPRPLSPKYLLIWERHQSGEKPKQLAAEMGLSRERIRQIIQRVNRRMIKLAETCPTLESSP